MQLTKLNTEIKPKPTRGEIIEALAIIQMEKLTKDREALQAEANEAVQRATRIASQFVCANITRLILDLETGSFYGNKIHGCHLQIGINHEDMPTELLVAVKSAQEAECRVPSPPKLDRIREEIKNSMHPDSAARVQSLIASNRDALESTLEILNKPKSKETT